MASDPIEWLRAQSARLRETAERATYFADVIGTQDRRDEANRDNSLADLIDGMLVQYQKWGVLSDEQGQARAGQALLSLGAVARHVSTVTGSTWVSLDDGQS